MNTALFVAIIGLFGWLTAMADVPELGTVIEGQTIGDAASCTWIRADYPDQGGDIRSQVGFGFTGQDGDSANNSPNDVVVRVSWYGMDG